MGGLSLWHWLIVLVIVVLVFGTKRLKNVGQDLGEAMKGFRKGMQDDKPADDRPAAQLPDASRTDASRTDASRTDASRTDATAADAPRDTDRNDPAR